SSLPFRRPEGESFAPRPPFEGVNQTDCAVSNGFR
ncbi:MAG: hypothetical protein QOE57_240, partial [Acidimicrobiaceae bacterium]|nr:hypothetical protein [Acidimicrobiaceae bacterium]